MFTLFLCFYIIKMHNMLVIGVDIGGTSIKGGIVNTEGQILARFRFKVSKDESGEVEIDKLASTINETIKDNNFDKKDILGVGIGMPGLLDMDKGVVISSPNLPNWNGYNLKEYIKNKTGLDVKLNNDANVAALGEARFGSGKQYNDLIMITLGTGVGGGIVINNHLYDGHFHQGGELGHMVIELDGRECGCGRKGCLEAYASATALVKDTKKMMEEHPESLLTDIEKELGGVDARNAFVGERRGDKYSSIVVSNYVRYLSEGLINFCNIFRPEAFVLSGGVSNEGEYLLEKIRKYLKEHTYGMRNSPKVDVVLASLGYDSGIIGAASLFFE